MSPGVRFVHVLAAAGAAVTVSTDTTAIGSASAATSIMRSRTARQEFDMQRMYSMDASGCLAVIAKSTVSS
jgi:hypothetical protein